MVDEDVQNAGDDIAPDIVDEADITDEDLDFLTANEDEDEGSPNEELSGGEEKGEGGSEEVGEAGGSGKPDGSEESEEAEEGESEESSEAEEAESGGSEETGESTDSAEPAPESTPEPKTPIEQLQSLLAQNPELAQQLLNAQLQQQQQLQTQPQSQLQPQQQPQPQPQLTPEQAQQQFLAARQQAEELIADYYKLSNEDVEALESDPVEFLKTAIPRLTARVYTDAVLTSIQRVQESLPTVVTTLLQQQEETKTAEEKFFEQWPQLREHKDTVTRIAAAYRQINPDMPAEQFMRDVGVQAMVMLGLTVDDKGHKDEPKQKAFKPAARKKAPSTLEPDKPKNIYEQLDAELFDDE